jgi:hypothetical protein
LLLVNLIYYLRKLYCHHHYPINNYGKFVSQMTLNIWVCSKHVLFCLFLSPIMTSHEFIWWVARWVSVVDLEASYCFCVVFVFFVCFSFPIVLFILFDFLSIITFYHLQTFRMYS